MTAKERRVVLMIILIIVVITAVILVVKNVNKQKSQNNNTQAEYVDKALEENKDMKELTSEEQEQYEITDVSVTEDRGQTIITGKVTNKNDETKKVAVNVRFYSEENKIKGAATEKVTVNAGETKDFEMSIQASVSQYRYNIVAEYAN